MRTLPQCVAVLMLAVGALAAEPLKLARADQGKTVQAVVGQPIEISLSGNPTTGYLWSVAAIEGKAVEPLGEIAYVQNPNPGKLVGAGGVFVAKFKAVAAGTATLKLAYRRPWEKDVAPIETFTVTVGVRAK